MATAYYLTYTQIRVQPEISPVAWRLSDEGRARVIRMAGVPWLGKVKRIVSGGEQRTIEAAEIIARRRCIPVEINVALRDLDRPAEDFLSVVELDATVDFIFARPDNPARPGWETARNAQQRIAAGFDNVISSHAAPGDLLIVGSGAAGALLLCHLAGREISRDCFEPTPGGNVFAFDLATRRVVFPWRPADT